MNKTGRILTLERSLTAVHVYGCVAFFVARVRVVEQQTVRAQFLRELTVRGTMVIKVALDRVGVKPRLLRTLEFIDGLLLLLPERQAYGRVFGFNVTIINSVFVGRG